MRASEFVNEGKARSKLRKSTRQSVSNLETWPELDNNNNPYLAYRFGVAMAGAPADDMDKLGPVGSSFTTLGYSSAEKEITKAAAKVMGVTPINLTGPGSEELNSTNTVSPMPDRNKLSK